MVIPEIDGVSDLELIGKGGQSVVYKGWQETFDRFVAVKILNIDDETAAKRFNSEQKAMGRLSTNAGVVTVFNTITLDDGRPALIMPFFENGSVADLLQEGGMPWREAAEIVSSVSATIASAHDLGVIHRDLKPANILLDDDGHPLVADFGIAKLATDSTASQSTSLSFTPVYSPPESFSSGRPTKATDVYGLGATLWALLAGHAPYRLPGEAIDMMVLFHRVINEPLGAPTSGLPAGLEAVLERAVAKDPEHRFTDASHFADALNAVIAEPDATPDIAMPVAHPDPPGTEHEDVEPLPLDTPSGPPRLESTTMSGVVTLPPVHSGDEGDVFAELDGLGEEAQEAQERSRRGWMLPVGAFAAALLVMVLGGVAVSQMGGGSTDGSEVATGVSDDLDESPGESSTTEATRVEQVSDEATDPLGPFVTLPDDEGEDDGGDDSSDTSAQPATLRLSSATANGISTSSIAVSVGSNNCANATFSAGNRSATSGTACSTNLSGTITGLAEDTAYTITIRAIDEFGQERTTTVSGRTRQGSEPPPPGLVVSSPSGSATGPTTATVSIRTNNCATFTTSNGNSSATCSTSASATLTGLTPNTTHNITINVTDEFGQRASTTVTLTTEESVSPLNISSAIGDETGPTTATVSIRTNNCATFTTSNGNSSATCSTSASATLTGLTPNTTHNITINVTDEFGQRASTTVTLTTPPEVIPPLEIVRRRGSAQSQTAGFVGLDTNQCVTAVFTYQWNNTTRTVDGCTTTPGISIAGLTPDTRYTVSVRVTDQFGQVLTDSLSFITPPDEVIAEGISIDSINFGGARVCSQTPFTATASVTGTPVSWNWNSGRLHIDNWQAAGSATLRPDVVAGTWPVTLTVTNDEGVSATRTFNLTVLDDGNGCPGLKTQ